MEIIRWKSALLSCLFTFAYYSHIVPTLVAVILLTVSHQHLTPVNVFMLLAMISMLKTSVLKVPGDGCQAIYDSYASLDRIQQFLLLDNLPPIPNFCSTENLTFEVPPPLKNKVFISSNNLRQQPTSDTLEKATTVAAKLVDEKRVEETLHQTIDKTVRPQTRSTFLKNVTCRAQGDTKFILEDINFELHDSDFVVVTGTVGSGKSTLLSAIIGETPLDSGKIKCTNSIAYVPQTPWIFSGTLRDNVLFGKPFEEEWYEKVTSACALKQDIDGFPEGDLTIVGERGVGLSGGQRARVSLARAVYTNADVFLLDNPLSAVDRKVNDHIFTACICSLLSEKARMLVSHNETHMKAAGRVIVLSNGVALGQGSFQEVKASGLLETVLDATEEKSKGGTEEQIKGIDGEQLQNTGVGENSDDTNEARDGGLAKGLEILEEDQMVGVISSKLYWEYLTFGVPTIAVIGFIMVLMILQGK